MREEFASALQEIAGRLEFAVIVEGEGGQNVGRARHKEVHRQGAGEPIDAFGETGDVPAIAPWLSVTPQLKQWMLPRPGAAAAGCSMNSKPRPR